MSPEAQVLAARPDRRQNAVWIGRRQYEYRVIRRFLQRFQEGVVGRPRKLVHLIDDVHLESRRRGPKAHLLAQVADVIHAGVAGGVDLDQVDKARRTHLQAVRAAITGLRLDAFQAVDGLRQQPCHRCFAGATLARKQVGVAHPVVRQCILQNAHDVLLPDHFRKQLRSILVIKGLEALLLTHRSRPPHQQKKRPCTRLRTVTPALPEHQNSSQAGPRHPRVTPYRCFLPDLTGFGVSRRTGPDLQRSCELAESTINRPLAGVQPR